MDKQDQIDTERIKPVVVRSATDKACAEAITALTGIVLGAAGIVIFVIGLLITLAIGVVLAIPCTAALLLLLLVAAVVLSWEAMSMWFDSIRTKRRTKKLRKQQTAAMNRFLDNQNKKS